jgi:hypothetical protein
MQSPGSTTKPEKRRVSSRSRFEKLMKNNLWMSQNSGMKNDGFYQKEDIEDQLNSKKTELNRFVTDNTKLRTKNAMFKD